jgi:hypothetical protein
LLNLDPLAEQLESVGQPAALLGLWFMRFQRDAMALTLTVGSPDNTRRFLEGARLAEFPYRTHVTKSQGNVPLVSGGRDSIRGRHFPAVAD